MHPFCFLEMARNTALKSSSRSILISIFIFIIIWTKAGITQAQTLPRSEFDALKAIAKELGKTDWDFTLNPCDNNTIWTTPKRIDLPQYNNTVNCNCSFPGGVCHVENIFLKGQDLQGVLPPSLAKLPFLKNMDFTRNYLNGTIPPEWATMNLEYLSVVVNRLSGPIPKYLGNFKTLVYINLESNMFDGTVPAELGKLENLANLILSDNKLTGHLPAELRNLKKLQEIRLSSNNFTGMLPDVQSWQSLQSLEIKASGFQGPIPPSISFLKNLTELRISNIKGGPYNIPPLGELKSMKDLVLRSCNIVGDIPGEISNMGDLKFLDLSFNKLEGNIPNFDALDHLEMMFLTGNLLTGPIPNWIKNKDAKHQIDLSYNNFSRESQPPSCTETLNLYKSSDDGKHSEQAKCLESFPCSKDNYSLHINCGGNSSILFGNRLFEADSGSGGPANFEHSNANWGTSSTGYFWNTNATRTLYGVTDYSEQYTITQLFPLSIYTTARLSPLSLTYYGRCLASGNYNVTLYFAEIVFRDNRSYQSLGRRMFDVYIQGERKLVDFDIRKEAQGVDRAVQKQFKGVQVKNGNLEIRFAYAGKGSTAVPRRGVYGPLISAISIEYDSPPPSHPSQGKTKFYIELGASAAVLLIILIILAIFWRRWYRRNRISREEELRGLDLRTGKFTYRQIQAATDNFIAGNKIGEGGFGAVYKGTLLDGTAIAVKQLSQRSQQGSREFVNEVGMISGLMHPNVVRLYGCCIEGKQLFLVYEYLENNNLARALFGPEDLQLELDWATRKRICIGISKGLAFLHDESTLKIVHRDIKTNNILLDSELNPKISDFGLAKLDDEENTHMSTRIAGTLGYMAPEYALWGYLTFKADVYSFGIVALEIIVGKSNMAFRPSEEYVCLLDLALVLQKRGRLLELVDPRLGSSFNEEEALRMIKVSLMCTNTSPALRPTMSAVVSILEGRTTDNDVLSDPSVYHDGLELQGLTDNYDELHSSSSTEAQSISSSYEKRDNNAISSSTS